jgi:AraC-like DNA-binding protein
MDRDQPFYRYVHDACERVEIPMHTHANGQLNYVSSGRIRLLTPNSAWVVPHNRLIWIPPRQPHSVQCRELSGSWKIMVPPAYGASLPKTVAVIQPNPLLVAALEAMPGEKTTVAPTKLKLLRQLIQLELRMARTEALGVTLPKSARLRKVTDILLERPDDPRDIDSWAKEVGMSRSTFTRKFAAETGSPFATWKTAIVLGKALDLLSEGLSIGDISARLGYSGPSAFVAAFRRRFGAPPAQFSYDIRNSRFPREGSLIDRSRAEPKSSSE